MRAAWIPAIAVCIGLAGACSGETLLGVEGEAVSPGLPTETATTLEIEAGVYELTARITRFDPAWGDDLTDYRYVGSLILEKDLRTWSDWSGTAGRFEDLHGVLATGTRDDYQYHGKIIARRSHRPDRLVLELVGEGFTLTLIPTRASGDGQAIKVEGDFGRAGHIGGPFSAELRPAN